MGAAEWACGGTWWPIVSVCCVVWCGVVWCGVAWGLGTCVHVGWLTCVTCVGGVTVSMRGVTPFSCDVMPAVFQAFELFLRR